MTTNSISILRLPQVKALTGLSRSTIYNHIDQGTFPKQISLGARAVGWIDREIHQWVAARIAQTRPTGLDSHFSLFQKTENRTSEGVQQ